MSILVNEDTKVLVQGITGGFGGRHAGLSLDYGTALVAGVTPVLRSLFLLHLLLMPSSRQSMLVLSLSLPSPRESP